MAARNTITLKMYGGPIRNEALAHAAIKPGHLVQLNSDGEIQAHATAGGAAPERAFAIEDELQGKEVGDEYAVGSIVQYNIFRSGDVVLARIYNGENIARGDKLESQGDGTLRKVDTDTSAGLIAVQSIIGVALEACDMSGSSGVDVEGGFCAVRII